MQKVLEYNIHHKSYHIVIFLKQRHIFFNNVVKNMLLTIILKIIYQFFISNDFFKQFIVIHLIINVIKYNNLIKIY